MMNKTKSELTKEGPFPNHFDPWLEHGHYFHQFHAQLIGALFIHLQDTLYEMNYSIGRESSVQVEKVNLYPDIFIRQTENPKLPKRDYHAAMLELDIDAGIDLQTGEKPELDKLFIKNTQTKRVVTIIEIISPSNKQEDDKIIRYQNRREELLKNAVDLVEIDLTRSYKRLLDDTISHLYPYHIALHLFDSFPKFLGIRLDESLKTFGLPVEDKFIPIDLHQMYRKTYAEMRVAYQMLTDDHYTAEKLPFPTTITEAEREKLLADLAAWKAQLK